MHQQALVTDASNVAEQFKSQLHVAVSSRSDDQRRDALAYLMHQVSAKPPNNPVGTLGVLTKLLPLVSDSSAPVRGQLLKLFRALPASEMGPHAERVLMYARSGMTHLADDIRRDTLAVLEWLLEVAGREAVSCPGGWMKTLSSFSSMLGWNPAVSAAMSSKGWTSAPKSAVARRGAPQSQSQSQARQMQVLARFLEVGLGSEKKGAGLNGDDGNAYWNAIYCLPRTPGPFAYLNLFGTPRDEDGDMYPDMQSRRTIFDAKWRQAFVDGVNTAKREGGAVGRAASTLDQILQSCS